MWDFFWSNLASFSYTGVTGLREDKERWTWTIKASDARRITAAEIKYVRRTAGHTWTDYKTNAQIAKELKITPILDKLLEYKRSLIQHVNRMPRNRLPRVMKHYSPTGRKNRGRPLKRLPDTWDRSGPTIGPSPWRYMMMMMVMMMVNERWSRVIGNALYFGFYGYFKKKLNRIYFHAI